MATNAYRNWYAGRSYSEMGMFYCAKGNIARETEKAIALSISEGNALIWLPKSQIEIEYSDADSITIHMPYWLAKKSGLATWDIYGYPTFDFQEK